MGRSGRGPNWRATIARPVINYTTGVRTVLSGTNTITWLGQKVWQAPLLVCSFYVPNCRCHRTGPDRIGMGSAEHARASLHCMAANASSIEPPIIGSTVSPPKQGSTAQHISIASQFPMPRRPSRGGLSTNPAETTRDALWAGQWSSEECTCS